MLRGLAAALLATWLAAGWAQPSTGAEGDDAAPAISATDRAELLRQVTAPVPDGTPAAEMRRQFSDKADAAARLGDPALQQQVLRAAMERLPAESRWPNDLAWLLFDLRRWDDAAQLWDQAVARAGRPSDKLFYEVNRLTVEVTLRRAGAAEQLAALRRRAEALLPTLGPSYERVMTQRALGHLAMREAELAGHQVLLGEALAARALSERHLREAFDTVVALPPDRASSHMRRVTANSLSNAQRERALALSRLGRYGEAAVLVEDNRAFVVAQRLGAVSLAAAHHAAGAIEMHRGAWAAAERKLLLSIQALDEARMPRTHPHQISRTRDLLLVMWATGRAAEARAALDALDARIRSDKVPVSRARMPFERGLVYLASGRERDAVALFEELARGNLASLGASHYYTAQAQGLHGAALWAAGAPGQREAAFELLRQAVLEILSPRNVDWLGDSSVRRPVRELIFKAYLDAAAWRGGLQAMIAMGVADRLIAGSTSQAIGDAAVRAAAGDPALAELVRQEQDLKQRLLAARGDESAVPDEAQRRRAADLELQRQQIQETLRARYPGYDQLLRPPLAGPTEVAQRLRRDEVLLLAMPTDRALYLWAVGADELPMFVRVDASDARLLELVRRLRRGLDFDANNGRAGPFDEAAADELYRLVLAPVAARIDGRRHLIVATTGALAQIPFSVLRTGPAGSDGPAWLVRRIAVSQVPSVAAWLQLRQLPPLRPAPEPLLAWADPSFVPREAPPAGRSRQATLRYQDLPPLPETLGEAQTIARSLRADPDRDVIAGMQATRESVLAANRSGTLARKRVLVFATHGLKAGDLPGLEQPALAMAATAGQGDALASLIGLDDVLGFKLNADWVVLSACNTAAADGRAEEALTGLARGFLYAGTRSLLVTHWAVETDSARLLTTATFEHHAANPQATKAESLRQAMLRVMARPKTAHPAYWAPFALVGDGAR